MPEKETRELLKELKKRPQPKQEESREYPRERTFIHVECSSNKCTFPDFIQNISASGLYIETQIPLFPDQALSMTFPLSNAEDPIKITGKIVRVDPKGLGTQFDKLLPDI